MGWLDGMRARLAGIVERDRAEEEMAEEMRFHLEMEAGKLEAEGMSAEQARREAEKRFGGVERHEEAVRDERGSRLLDDVLQDLKYGARTLRRSPGMALVLICTLALGIGAATAVFSIVNSVLLNPLPYPDADRLVIMREVERTGVPNWAAHPNFVDWREQATRSFETMTSVEWPAHVTVLGATEPVRVLAMGVSREYFDVAEVPPYLGRVILPEENRPGGAATVVVSYGFWQQYLNGDGNLSSYALQLNGEPHQVVGVMPPDFRFMGNVAMWFPYERRETPGRMMHAYRIIGRLRPGVTIEQARAEMTSVSKLLLDEYGDGTRAVDVSVQDLHEFSVGGSRRSLMLLLGAAGLLLLVACTNIASTLLARGMAREQEIAVRMSMGAGRMRLVRQLFTESLVVAIGGVVLGVLLAFIAVRVFSTLGVGRVPRMAEVAISPGVLIFSVILSFVAAILFGLLPAVRLADREVASHLRAATRGNTAGSQTLWRGLVAAEIAMATVLLIGAGLLVRSLSTILAVDVGYRTENVMSMAVTLPDSKYGDSTRIRMFYEQLLPELQAIAGVEVVGITNQLPLNYGSYTSGTSAEDPGGNDGIGTPHTAGWRVVNADYFEALGIPIVAGRGFTPQDTDGTLDVAIVNAPLAARLWPGEDPLGKRVRNGFDPRSAWFTVVGVVAQARSWQTDEQLEMYVPYTQRPEFAGAMNVLVATRERPDALSTELRERVRAVDPDVPVELATLHSVVNTSVGGQRFTMLVLLAFAAAALILAVIGVYGVVSYSVARRRREIGIRLALGAAPARVRALIQRSALVIALVGVAIGAAIALGLSSVMRSMLYEIQPTDPLTFTTAILALLAAAAAASYIPARRSTRVDPMITMRAE